MSRVLIVYHSHTGNTEAMAKAIYDGAVSAGATVSLKKAADATAEDILDCDVVAFGTPNNFHYMAGAMKDFFDRVWLKIGDRAGNKLYTTFSTAGSCQPTQRKGDCGGRAESAFTSVIRLGEE